MGAAVVGLVPWIVTGMRLPLQNLWAIGTTEASDMPIALLPFSQYAVSLIAAVVLVGGTIAGIAVRALRPRLGRPGTVAAFVGLAALQLVALVETATVTAAGLRMDRFVGTGAGLSASQVYLAALVVGTLGAIALAVVLGVLVARAPQAVAVVALAVSAVALGSWTDALVLPPVRSGGEATAVLLSITRWVPAVALGVAIAWTRLRSIGQGIAAVLGLAVLWVGTALVTAATAAFGARVYLPYPLEMASFGAQVFVSAMGPAGTGFGLVVVALVVGIVGAVALRWRATRVRPAATAGGGTSATNPEG